MTCGFAGYSAVLMVLVCSSYLLYTAHAERRKVDWVLKQAAQDLRTELVTGEHSLRRPQELLAEEEGDLRAVGIAVLIIDPQGRVVAHSRPPVPPWPLGSANWRVTSFTFDGQRVVIGSPWDKVEHRLREHALVLLALTAIVVAASAAGAWMLVGRTLSPIDHLARQAQTASAESLRVRLEAPSADAEIARLVVTLNELLDRLERTAAARGRFYAAASHELRTPLQALAGLLEVALSRERSGDEYRHTLVESHAQTERLTSLVQDLLLLNQLDMATSCPPAVWLDAADICETELAHLTPLAAERGLRVEATLPDHCEMNAPWNHITMLLRNLLENAVKYAEPGGLVRVHLTPANLRIWNEGVPEAGTNLQQYFEPFYRPDAARQSQTGGNGLGLAICKAICDANNWHIDLRIEDGGVGVEVRFA